MIDGIPNRPLYFYQKDTIAMNHSEIGVIGTNLAKELGDTTLCGEYNMGDLKTAMFNCWRLILIHNPGYPSQNFFHPQ